MTGSTTSSGGGNVDLPTLLITAVASAAAAYVTSKIWAPGTLGAAAFTPVLVALIKEMLARPAEVVTRAVPVRGVVRSSSGPEDVGPAPAGNLARGTGTGAGPETPEDIESRIAQLGEAPGISRPGRRRAWQAAVVTGLLGFLVAAVIITVPELVAGSSASGEGRETTFFGGGKSSSNSDPATTNTTTETTPTTTETGPLDETVTVPPAAETVTVPPPAVTVPEGEVPVDPEPAPEATGPAPAQPPPP